MTQIREVHILYRSYLFRRAVHFVILADSIDFYVISGDAFAFRNQLQSFIKQPLSVHMLIDSKRLLDHKMQRDLYDTDSDNFILIYGKTSV